MPKNLSGRRWSSCALLTAGQGNDITQAKALLEEDWPGYVLADKDYDSRKLVQWITAGAGGRRYRQAVVSSGASVTRIDIDCATSSSDVLPGFSNGGVLLRAVDRKADNFLAWLHLICFVLWG